MYASSQGDRKRLGWLDFGKALGILVVLLVHAEWDLGPVNYYGGMFYMPVFFVAAGYTYRRKDEPFADFVKKKAARLLLPYGAASLFLWLFFWVKDSCLAGNPADLHPAALFGVLYSRNQMYVSAYSGANPVLMTLLNAPLWFLTAMFLTYVWYGWTGRRKRPHVWRAAGLLLSMAWHYGTELLLPWSLDAVPYFACYMAAGEWLRERDGIARLTEKGGAWRIALLTALFVAAAWANGSANLSIGDYGRSMLLNLITGTAGSVLVFLCGVGLERLCAPAARLLEAVGQETLTILCLHMFLYMFIRVGTGALSLPQTLTNTLLVFGSAAALTAAGRLWKRIR